MTYSDFFDEAKDNPWAKSRVFCIGKIKSQWQKRLQKHGIALLSLDIVQRTEDVLHATRPKKPKKIDEKWWKNIRQHVQNPDCVILDKTKSDAVLLLIYKDDNAQAKKITIQMNKLLKNNGKIVNILRTGGVVNPQGLQGANYVLLEGKRFWLKN